MKKLILTSTILLAACGGGGSDGEQSIPEVAGLYSISVGVISLQCSWGDTDTSPGINDIVEVRQADELLTMDIDLNLIGRTSGDSEMVGEVMTDRTFDMLQEVITVREGIEFKNSLAFDGIFTDSGWYGDVNLRIEIVSDPDLWCAGLAPFSGIKQR